MMDVLLGGGFMWDLSTKSQVKFDPNFKMSIAETLSIAETRALFGLPPIPPTETQLELFCASTSGVLTRTSATGAGSATGSAATAAVRVGSVGVSPLFRPCA